MNKKSKIVYGGIICVYIAIIAVVMLMIVRVPRDYLEVQETGFNNVRDELLLKITEQDFTESGFEKIADKYPVEFIVYNETKDEMVYRTLPIDTPMELEGILSEKGVNKEVVFTTNVASDVYYTWLAQYNVSPQIILNKWLLSTVVLVGVLFTLLSVAIISITYRLVTPLKKLRENIYKVSTYQLDNLIDDAHAEGTDSVMTYELSAFARDLRQKITDAEVVYTSLERELQMKNEVSEYRARLLATLSHDLKTPLHTAQLQMEKIMATTEFSNPKTAYYFDLSYQKIITVLEDINNLLKVVFQDDITQIQHIETFDLVSELYEVNEMFLDEIAEHNLEISINTDEEVLFTGNKIRMKQLIHNAFSNIVRYAHIDGQVEVECYREANKMYLTFYNDANHIPDADLERVFQLFYRMGDSDKGTGVGMYAIKQIVEENNGHVTFTNERSGVLLTCAFIEE